MATMPAQRPGKSKQDYQTPPELLRAITGRLGISNFAIDLAASAENAVCRSYFDENFDSLRPEVTWNVQAGKWGWLNPPYANIRDWVKKASIEAAYGAQIVMLIPASPGANWWRDYVQPFAYVTYLNGRVTFVGAEDPYPKDCALLLYTPWGFTGNDIWTWQRYVPELPQSEPSEDQGLS
jgi:phage N-6-adenine-methyltransferase